MEVKYDEDLDTYFLGGDVDGVFVPFAEADGAYVRQRVETHKAAEAEASSSGDQPAAEAPAAEPGTATEQPAGAETQPAGDQVPPEGVAP